MGLEINYKGNKYGKDWYLHVKPGDILYSQYNYNRIIINFYVVVRATAKSVWIVPMEKRGLPKTWQPEWKVMPGNVIAGKEPLRRLRISGMKIDDYNYLRAWDGTPKTEMSD